MADEPTAEELSGEEELKKMLDSMGVESVDESADENESTDPAPIEASAEAVEEAETPEAAEASVDAALPETESVSSPATDVVASAPDSGAEEAAVPNPSKVSVPVTPTPNAPREMTVSTMIHLMGLPTAKQFQMLEKSLDSVNSKLGLITSRIDKLAIGVELSQDEALFERIDFQLSEIKNIMKKVGPPGGSAASASGPAATPRPKPAAKVLTSEPTAETSEAAPATEASEPTPTAEQPAKSE